MPNPLEQIIISHIEEHGPITAAELMGFALTHPEHGYYMKQDPFGRAGDFITAPEVSQMFGEMIGIWTADLWIKMGQPKRCMLIELGPGRGTLMADLMRGTKNVPSFHDALEIHLVEMSPRLREIQEGALSDHDPKFHDSIHTVMNHDISAPKIIIANEFFDALPIRQFQKTSDGFEERVVTIVANKKLTWSYRRAEDTEVKSYKEVYEKNKIFEVSQAQDDVLETISEGFKQTAGGLLVIDYGHTKPGFGDTLQAIKNHAYCDVLHDIGNADLTAHVDFHRLGHIGSDKGQVFGPVTQQTFLKSMGIDVRAEQLKSSANPEQKVEIDQALQRLTDPDQMGELFKVMGIIYGQDIEPTGF